MAVQTSTVPTALANLKTLLEANATIVTDSVLVTDFPVDNEDEFIYIGDVDPHEYEPMGIAAGIWPMEETYVINVIVSVIRNGPGEMDQAVSRAYVLAGCVETALRADRTGMTVTSALRTALIKGAKLQKLAGRTSAQVEARVTVPIECTARRVTS